MSKNQKNEFYFQIVILGDSNIGKTCFLQRLTEETYSENHLSTVGMVNY